MTMPKAYCCCEGVCGMSNDIEKAVFWKNEIKICLMSVVMVYDSTK